MLFLCGLGVIKIYGLKNTTENTNTGYICPKCSGELSRRGGSLVCGEGHCYDISRHGYVNLLMSTKSGASVHGDNREMVAARQEFLDRGYYIPLRDAVCEAMLNYLPAYEIISSITVLDAGCGDCWYSYGIHKALSSTGRESVMLCVDISKEALIAGMRRSSKLRTVVASVFNLPVKDKSVNVLFNIFSPLCSNEYFRVIKPEGLMIRAVPLPRHLWELKLAIYDTPYENELPRDDSIPGFEKLSERDIEFMISVDNRHDIMNLFTMTPYRYNTSSEGLNRINSVQALNITCGFRILTFRKRNN